MQAVDISFPAEKFPNGTVEVLEQSSGKKSVHDAAEAKKNSWKEALKKKVEERKAGEKKGKPKQ